ncbi:multicopper oxidase family protein [Paraburkholderia acidisoli]|uniref:Multicopper oxidase domain-containing protein n=1 Tax=Paraburkholderia acidisoli TaxID=2571748 RepID=A0A7Z2GHZ3_9BURK|nr:multicopper oxidase family protein [Paraburkholderia acidisoli]QGZ62157.1 multicopper oxidase domain-containing protein [Paraburkholderia acidisoli]
MKRRAFLSGSASLIGAAVASVFARESLAQSVAQSISEPAHDSMHGMQAMPGMAPASSAMPASAPLAAVDALPAGAPLAALRTLANERREPGHFRATLVAQPAARPLLAGQAPTPFWQYDASGPGDTTGPVIGPMLDLQEGDNVEITFVNRLAQPSTIHWHGLPVPPDQDGNPMNPVAPGEQRVYRFTLPAGSAGTYWYHPHPHMQSAEQVFRGLAGPIVVRAADDPLAAWPERHLFVSDLKLAADGTIPANGMMDWMNGREGQFVLLNGAREPLIEVARDERWRVWNGCNARYVQLAFDDGRAFAQVGTDGGLLGAPREGVTSLLLAPGERAELIVRAAPRGAPGAQVALVAAQYDRKKMAMSHGSLPATPTQKLATVRFLAAGAEAQAPQAALPRRLRPIAPLLATSAKQKTPRKTVVFSEAMDMHAMHQPGASALAMPRGMQFMVNGATWSPSRVTFASRRGEVETWAIENRSDMDHPFHLHGTQFQVLAREQGGTIVEESLLAWRDTVNVRPGETVHIATVQREAGDRMFHCHILEHEDLGMMGVVRVS